MSTTTYAFTIPLSRENAIELQRALRLVQEHARFELPPDAPSRRADLRLGAANRAARKTTTPTARASRLLSSMPCGITASAKATTS